MADLLPLLTPLELTVLCRVARGEDPWSGIALHEVTGNGGIRGGSRVVSQALGRLQRKGMLEKRPYRLTAAGSNRYAALGGPPIFPQDGIPVGDLLDAQGHLLRTPMPSFQERTYCGFDAPSPAIGEVLFPKKVE